MPTPRPNLIYRRDAIVTELERRRAIPADERAAAIARAQASVESATRAAAETAGLLPTDADLEKELAEVNAEIAEHDRAADTGRTFSDPFAEPAASTQTPDDPTAARSGRSRFND